MPRNIPPEYFLHIYYMPPKVKNTEYDRFHITISPKSGDASHQHLDQCLASIVQKQVLRYCYVIENGKNSDHPHLHLLLQYDTNKRRDTLKTSIITKVKKIIDVSPHTVMITPAYNPNYLITVYMQKEGEFINKGFDLELVKSESRSEKRQIYHLDSQLIPITFDSFIRLYRESKSLISPFSLPNFDTHINELIHILEQKTYKISFIFRNLKFCKNIIFYDNNVFHPLNEN